MDGKGSQSLKNLTEFREQTNIELKLNSARLGNAKEKLQENHINKSHDVLEISIKITKGKAFKPIIVKLNDLEFGNSVSDIWILNPSNSIVSLEYRFYNTKVERPVIEIDRFISIQTESESDIANIKNEEVKDRVQFDDKSRQKQIQSNEREIKESCSNKITNNENNNNSNNETKSFESFNNTVISQVQLLANNKSIAIKEENNNTNESDVSIKLNQKLNGRHSEILKSSILEKKKDSDNNEDLNIKKKLTLPISEYSTPTFNLASTPPTTSLDISKKIGVSLNSKESTKKTDNSEESQNSMVLLNKNKAYKNNFVSPHKNNTNNNLPSFKHALTGNGSNFKETSTANNSHKMFNLSKTDKTSINYNKDLINQITIETKEIKVNSFSNGSITNTNFPILSSDEILLKDKAKYKESSFCEGFFISGLLPNKPATYYESKIESKALCNHNDCSILQSYTPNIIAKYPEKSDTLDINNLSAKLCFNTGIKCCFTTEESKLKTPKSFISIITNQVGIKYYVMNYFFYLKMDHSTFKKTYGINIFNDTLKIEKILTEFNSNSESENKTKLEEKLKRSLEVCEMFGFNDYVYIPHAVSLVSKFANAYLLEKCLKIIVKLINDKKYTTNDLNKLIIHLVNEIPMPPPDHRLFFYLPYSITPFELHGGFSKKLPDINFQAKLLLDTFSIENIIMVHQLMLLEQRIIFVGNDSAQISETIDNFINMLYPFKWWHLYIPLLPEDFVEYVRALYPYLIGIKENLLDTVLNYICDEEAIYIVNIIKNSVDIITKSKKKKLSKKSLLKYLPSFPEEDSDVLMEELKKINKQREDSSKSKEKSKSIFAQLITTTPVTNTLPEPADDSKTHFYNFKIRIDKQIRKIFLRSMVRLFGDYIKYLTYINDIPVFNKTSFLTNRNRRFNDFYSDFIDSQMFQQFIEEDSKNSFLYFHKFIIRFNISKPISLAVKRSNSKKTILSTIDVPTQRRKSTDSLKNLTTVNLNGSLPHTNDKHDMTININNSTKHSINSHDNSKSSVYSCHGLLETNIILPYFVEENLIKSDYSKLEIHLKERFKEYISGKIIENLKLFEFDMIEKNANTKITIYFYETLKNLTNCFEFDLTNHKNANNNMNQVHSQRLPFSKKSTSTISLEDTQSCQSHNCQSHNCQIHNCSNNRTQSKADDKITQDITDYIRKIFTNDPLNNIQKNNLDSIFTKKLARIFFSQAVYQEKFDNHKTHCVDPTSFDDLSKMLSQALFYCSPDSTEYQSIRLIIKSTFFYYKIHQNLKRKENYYLYKDLVKKPGNFSVWMTEEFWEQWIITDFKENKNEFKLTKADLYFNILYSTSSVMIKLNLSLEFIINTIPKSLGSRYLINNQLQKDLETAIVKEHKNSKQD